MQHRRALGTHPANKHPVPNVALQVAPNTARRIKSPEVIVSGNGAGTPAKTLLPNNLLLCLVPSIEVRVEEFFDFGSLDFLGRR